MFSRTRVTLIICSLLLLCISVPVLAQPIWLPTNITTTYVADDETRPYYIPPNCTIWNNGYLFVDDGVTLVASTGFNVHGSITVTNGGRLYVEGTPNNRVKITVQDSTETWPGIHYTSTADSTWGGIRFCDITFADTALHVETNLINPVHSFLADSINYCHTGILAENCGYVGMSGGIFLDCTYGIVGDNVSPNSGNGGVSAYQCDFLDNTHPMRVQYSGYAGFSGKIINGTNGVYTRYCKGLFIDYDYELPYVIRSLIDNVNGYGVYAYRVNQININMLEVNGRDHTNWGIYIYNNGEVNDSTRINSTKTYDMDYTGTRLYRCDNVYIWGLDSYENHRSGLELMRINDFAGIYSSNLHRNDYNGLYMFNVQAQDIIWGDGYVYETYIGQNLDHGIKIEDSYLHLYDTNIEANNDYGMYVYGGVDLTIEKSQIADNGDEGIRVTTTNYPTESVDITIDSSDVINNDAGMPTDQIYSWMQGLDIDYGGNYIFSSTATYELHGPAPSALFAWYCRGNYWGEWPNASTDIVSSTALPRGAVYSPYLLADPGNGPFPEDPWADNNVGRNRENTEMPVIEHRQIDYTSLRETILDSQLDIASRINALNTYKSFGNNPIDALLSIKNQLSREDRLQAEINSRIASAEINKNNFENAIALYVENNSTELHTAHSLNILKTYYRWAESNVLENEIDKNNFEAEMDKELVKLPVIEGSQEFKPNSLQEYHLLLKVLENGIDAELSTGEASEAIIAGYELEAPYPNPFNPNVTIPFSLPDVAEIKVEVYNVLGEKVATLANGKMEAGKHQLIWNGVDNNGKLVSSGIYYVKMQAADFNQTNRVVFMK